MKFKEWLLEIAGWDKIEDYPPPEVHYADTSSPPVVRPGYVRLYRGTKIGELPHANAFFSDERGLEGVAKAFAKIPGRQLVYVDVPEDVVKKGLLQGAVTDGEYKIPEEYRKQIKVFPK